MTDLGSASFDLTDQPWIQVRWLDGRPGELSLNQVLAQAHQLAGVTGEIPTQTFAITRLLLAILHRAIDGPQDRADWDVLWQQAELPATQIADYLAAQRARFDLLHPVTPFYQVADLHTAKGETFGLERLIADAPTGRPFFTTRLGASLRAISFAEAARWLVHCQAFDPSGIKSGAVGDDQVKNNKGFPIGNAWAGMIGGVVCEGRNLRETLLLNLIAEGFDELFPAGQQPQAAWERPAQTAARVSRDPADPVDLYTWQSRRIRLVNSDDQITGVLVCNGDAISPQNRHRVEPMTAWQRSKNQEAKSDQPDVVYMPKLHDPARAFWRGLAALLPGQAGSHSGKNAAATIAPTTLRWIAHLQRNGSLSADYLVRTRALGMQYINNSSVIGEVIDDSLSLRAGLLPEGNAALQLQLSEGIAAIESGVTSLANLASDLAVAAGGESEPPRSGARATAFAALDGEVRTALSQLSPDTEPSSARNKLHQLARTRIRELGDELVHASGPSAWVGRVKKVGKNHKVVCTATADLRFDDDLNKYLPVTAPEQATKGAVA